MFEYILINAFIISFLYFSLFWSDSKHTIWFKPLEKLSKWIYYLGLDHAWHMFSPPPKAEMEIQAEIFFENGEVKIWDTTGFEKLDVFRAFLYMRRQIYKWSVSANKISACRSALANYLKITNTNANQKPVTINLYVIHQEVPAPENAHHSFNPPENRFLIHKWINKFDCP